MTTDTRAPLGPLGKGLKWLPPPEDESSLVLDSKQKADAATFTRPEKARKLVWSAKHKKWVSSDIEVQVAKGPFDRGFTRTVYRVNELSANGPPAELVGKILDSRVLKPLVGDITDKMYYNDARCLIVAQDYARAFNALAPQQINFCEPSLIRLQERPGRPMMCCEPFMQGKFKKHNNNDGAVLSKRLLPQAFTHFTHHKSNGKLMVCDIQGWDNKFTDPQIHSVDANSTQYGLGNQGRRGFKKFFKSHTCSAICGLMRLPRMRHGRPVSGWKREELTARLVSLGLPVPPPLSGRPAAPCGQCEQPEAAEPAAQCLHTTLYESSDREVEDFVQEPCTVDGPDSEASCSEASTEARGSSPEIASVAISDLTIQVDHSRQFVRQDSGRQLVRQDSGRQLVRQDSGGFDQLARHEVRILKSEAKEREAEISSLRREMHAMRKRHNLEVRRLREDLERAEQEVELAKEAAKAEQEVAVSAEMAEIPPVTEELINLRRIVARYRALHSVSPKDIEAGLVGSLKSGSVMGFSC